MSIEDYLSQLKDNEIIWSKRDSEITVLNYWKKPLICEFEGCSKETHLTSQSYPHYGPHHPICEEHYKELHAYLIVVASKVNVE